MNSEDLALEAEVCRDPYNLSAWQQYLQHKNAAPAKERNILFERALKRLPGSYKLWLHYLRERREQVRYDLELVNSICAWGLCLCSIPSVRGAFVCASNDGLSGRLNNAQVRGRCPTDEAFTALNGAYERALVFLHKMPRIWIAVSYTHLTLPTKA